MDPSSSHNASASAHSLAAASASVSASSSVSSAAVMLSAAAASMSPSPPPPVTPPTPSSPAAIPAPHRLLALVTNIVKVASTKASLTQTKTCCRAIMIRAFEAIDGAATGKPQPVPFQFLTAPLSRGEQVMLAHRAIELARAWAAQTPADGVLPQCAPLLVESWAECRVDSLRAAFDEACNGDFIASIAPTQEQLQQDEACVPAIQFIALPLRVLQPLLTAEKFTERLQPLAGSFRFLSPGDGVPTPVLPVRVQHALTRLWHEFPPSCPDASMKRRVGQGWVLALTAAAKSDPALALMRQQMIDFCLPNKPFGREGASAASPLTAVAASSSVAAAASASASGVVIRKVLYEKAGLDNVGNTCFINTVLQSLFMTDSLRADLLQVDRAKHIKFLLKGHQPVLNLQSVFAFLTATHRSSYRPSTFYQSLPEMFRDWSQQDAGEFAKHVLDAVGGGLKKYKRHVQQLEHGGSEATAEGALPIATETKAASADAVPVAAIAASDAPIAMPHAESSTSPSALPARTISMDTAVPMELDAGVRGGAVMATIADPALSAMASPSVVLVPAEQPSFVRAVSLPSPAASGIDMSADFYFGGQLLSTITCLTCKTRSTKSEAFLELPLALEIEVSRTPRSTPKSSPQVRPAATPASPPFAPVLAQALGIAQAAADNPEFALPAPRSSDPAAAASAARIDGLISGFLEEDSSASMVDVVVEAPQPAVTALASMIAPPPEPAAVVTPNAEAAAAAVAAVAALGVLAVVAQSVAPIPSVAASSVPSTPTSFPPEPTYVVPSGPLHLNAMLDHYFSAETLSGADAYKCESCNVKRTSTKQLRIVRPVPQHLLLCLKRNKYEMGANGTIVRSKILKEVKYPCVLKLPVLDACVDGAADATGKAASGREQFRTYVLYSVIFHSGTSAQNGHYYSISRHSDDDALKQIQGLVSSTSAADLARDVDRAGVSSDVESLAQGGPWYKCNDSFVSPSSWSELASVTEQHPTDVAYLLFYRSIDALQSPGHRYNRMTPADIATFPHHLLAGVVIDNSAYAQEKKETMEAISRALVPKRTVYAAQESKLNEAEYDADMS